MPEIMTVQEVAKYLRIHFTTVYRMLARKEIPAFRVGGDWRFSREDLERWIKEQQANGVS